MIGLDLPSLCKTTRGEAGLHRSHNIVIVDHLSHRGAWARKAATTVTTEGRKTTARDPLSKDEMY